MAVNVCQKNKCVPVVEVDGPKQRWWCAVCPPEQYLPDLARACALASVHAGGLVEPIYRLHATRLKLLHQPQALTPAALTLLARYLARCLSIAGPVLLIVFVVRVCAKLVSGYVCTYLEYG